jgi:DNA helicase-2/ATP-dependent DNA helicase PcrA
MSIHRAKGLEWPVVFVPCCSKEQMPSVYNDNIEEERRLLYVALTRTKQQLHIVMRHTGDECVFKSGQRT